MYPPVVVLFQTLRPFRRVVFGFFFVTVGAPLRRGAHTGGAVCVGGWLVDARHGKLLTHAQTNLTATNKTTGAGLDGAHAQGHGRHRGALLLFFNLSPVRSSAAPTSIMHARPHPPNTYTQIPN